MALITFRGRTQTTSRWARELGLSPSGLRDRLTQGWPLEEALTMPKIFDKSAIGRDGARKRWDGKTVYPR
jgi:hypothetical protein